MIELRAVLTRKLVRAFSPKDVRVALEALANFETAVTHPSRVLDAHELVIAERLSWFDALIAGAALRSHREVLYAEDFSHGHRLRGRLLVQDPFRSR